MRTTVAASACVGVGSMSRSGGGATSAKNAKMHATQAARRAGLKWEEADCEAGDRTAGRQADRWANRANRQRNGQAQSRLLGGVGVTGPAFLSPFLCDFGGEKRCFEGSVIRYTRNSGVK